MIKAQSSMFSIATMYALW